MRLLAEACGASGYKTDGCNTQPLAASLEPSTCLQVRIGYTSYGPAKFLDEYSSRVQLWTWHCNPVDGASRLVLT